MRLTCSKVLATPQCSRRFISQIRVMRLCCCFTLSEKPSWSTSHGACLATQGDDELRVDRYCHLLISWGSSGNGQRGVILRGVHETTR